VKIGDRAHVLFATETAPPHAAGTVAMEAPMSFVVGLILYVVVLGALDARLPWPPRRAAAAAMGVRS
jgi:hypothetical protein